MIKVKNEDNATRLRLAELEFRVELLEQAINEFSDLLVAAGVIVEKDADESENE